MGRLRVAPTTATALIVVPLAALLVVSAGIVANPPRAVDAPLAVPTSNSSASVATLPAGKQADLDHLAAELAAASAANAAAGVTKADDPGVSAVKPAPAGTILVPHAAAGNGTIFESTDPAPGSSVPVTSSWAEQTSDGSWVTVYAGHDPVVVAQGVVLVWSNASNPKGALIRIDAPGAHGALKIVAAQGDVLTLTAADGTTLSFDVSRLAFG